MIEYFYDDLTLEEVIKSTAAPGVDLITSGRRIQNPSAVVQSEKMKNLLEILKTRYDHIVMDTAPYGVVTDGAVMMKRAEDRKSTRLNSSHVAISYAVFCLKTKTNK